MNKNRVRRVWRDPPPADNTRQSPLSIINQACILGARVRKDACLPREICRDVRQRTDRTARGGDHVAEVSRGHSSRLKRAGPPENGRSIPGGLTPTKARTVPSRMAWVKGRGCQRACSCRHIAAVAEMSVASCLYRARQAMVLSLPVLTSRTAGYGPVCPVVWEGVAVRLLPIPIDLKKLN
jgi:hypothetical protein